ncbi:class F sortase [Streptomyces sp. NPDC050738]|uniref:class F sortase n=1 Tax=Streptomyces sp. NPDC050738 TaxID=3154744 RepID=UPI0034148B73
MPSATPTRVRIPSIGVDAPLTALTLDADRQLSAPEESDANLAGWFRDGTPPGADGTAIIAGHVDNDRGPAVFYNLGALKSGNRIEVDRQDGRTAVFTIDTVEAFSADDFPSRKVYGPGVGAELRVITCGAGFDKAKHRYRGNVVAFAHLTDGRRMS